MVQPFTGPEVTVNNITTGAVDGSAPGSHDSFSDGDTTAVQPSNDTRDIGADPLATPIRSSVKHGEQLLMPPSSTGSGPSSNADYRPSYLSNNLPPTPTSPSFRGSKICVAIDVSGSTYGDVLAAEKDATQAICKLIPRKLRPSIKIVPWNDECGTPVNLEELNSLQSHGGTDPNAFLDDSASRDYLQDADFWFLMTDGEIEEHAVRRFARSIREYGVHGKACIICIFGEPEDKPARCNVTVGISVFAGSPHAAFLFHDVEMGKTYILQTKGCFSALLPSGQPVPKLDYETTWDDLPQTTFENLNRVHVPPPETVGKDELILQDNSRLNMTDFLRDLPEDGKTISKILDNEENLNAIAVSAKLRDETGRLQSWLDRIDAKYADASVSTNIMAAQAETGTQRSNLVNDAPERLAKEDENNDDSEEDVLTLTGYPLPVRPTLPSSIYQSTPTSSIMQPMIEVTPVVDHERRSSLGHLRRISSGDFKSAGETLGRPGPLTFPSASSASSGTESAPGFNKPAKSSDMFKATCMKCLDKNMMLCLVLREPPEPSFTDHFPAVDSQSMVRFPMAMGNYAEMDIVASDIVCDPCAARYVRSRRGRCADDVVAVLPLVPFLENRTAWLETINNATSKRFHPHHIPLVFVGVLYTKLERLVYGGHHAHSDLCEGIKWAANALLSEVVLQPTGIPQLDQLGFGALNEVLLRSFSSTLSNPSNTTLLEYPMDGFIAANAALSNSKQGGKLRDSKRKNVIFLKFLYHLTASFHAYRAENDSVVTEAAKSLMLLNKDEQTGSSSLFKWERIREISVRFSNAIELRKFFSRRGSYKLSITVNDLAKTPFLAREDLQAFERLGVGFYWISSQAAHATAVFVHHLFRLDVNGQSARDCFVQLRNKIEIQQLLQDPADISAKKADDMIKRLPPS